MSQIAYCRRHKDTETSVSCSRCGDPICPSCMVHAPVGVRCLDCARANPIPTFDVSAPFVMRAIGAGVAVALLGGTIVIAAMWFFPILYLPAILIAALGYGMGEAISLATNRKRGFRLKLVSGVCMLLGFSLIAFVTGAIFGPINLLGGVAGFYLALSRF